MTDIEWADERLGFADLVRAAMPAALMLGALAGAVEFGFIGAHMPLALGFDEAVLLGLVTVVLGVVLAGAMLPAAAGIAGRITAGNADTAVALALGLLGGAVAAWHLWPMGSALMDQAGRAPSAAAFFAMPLGVVGVVHVNARYWVRRRSHSASFDPSASTGGIPLIAALTAGAVLVTAFVSSGRSYGTGMALDTDAPVLLITVDALRRDHVSIYGGGTVSTPSMDELGEQGVVFDNAVTPTPDSVPAHAAIMTGMHPVRTGVLSDGHALHPRHQTLATRLAAEGYATAGFVSSAALQSGSGLQQGFQVYDDDFSPVVRGLRRIRTADWAFRAAASWMGPSKADWRRMRAGEQTMGHALSWLRDNGRRPFFVWVHLVEPHAPYQTHGAAGAPQVDHEAMMASGTREHDSRTAASLRDLYAEEVVHTDALIGDFVDAVRDVVDRPMTVVLASAHGELLGEHGIQFNPSGLYDESVRVPLIIVPHKGSPIHRRVSPQVRLMDIPNTVLAVLGIDTVDAIESGDLAGFWNDLQSRDYASFLMGRVGDRFDEGTLFGYRAAKSDGESGEMLKYIWNPASGQSWLYDLGVDPGESVDISLSQAAVVEAMERQVRKELGTAAPEGALVSPEALAIIRAMEGLR